jgi:hypothetical protein
LGRKEFLFNTLELFGLNKGFDFFHVHPP